MKKTLFLIFALISFAEAQTISFGAEVMPRKNFLLGGNSEKNLNNLRPEFILIGRYGDSTGFFYTQNNSTSSIEIPLYLRYRAKRRWSFDLTYSLSKFTISSNGKAAPYGSFYENYYNKQLYMDSMVNYYGYDYNVAENFYNTFIKEQKDAATSAFQYTEIFKQRSFAATATYIFSPQKTFKPYVTAGLAYKRKITNYEIQTFNYNNQSAGNLMDYENIYAGVVKAPSNMVFMRFGGGVETYRFRLGFNIDISGVSSETRNSISANGHVTGITGNRPYYGIATAGFYLGTDLFTRDLKSDFLTLAKPADLSEIPHVSTKKEKWNFGMRLNSSVKYNLKGYYSEKYPLNVAAILSVPEYGYQATGLAYQDYYYSVLSIKDIKLAECRPQYEAFIRRNLMRNFSVEGYLGFNNLSVDFETTELRAKDKYYSGFGWGWDWNYENTIYRGVFRKKWTVVDMGFNAVYQAVNKDLFNVRLLAGFNFNVLSASAFETNSSQWANVSDLSHDFNEWMEAGAPTSMDNLISGPVLGFYEGKMNADIYSDWAVFYNEFVNVTPYNYIPEKDIADLYPANRIFKPKNTFKSTYGSFRIGAEAEFNRFLIGFNYEMNLGYMQGVLLKSYSNATLMLGYMLYKH